MRIPAAPAVPPCRVPTKIKSSAMTARVPAINFALESLTTCKRAPEKIRHTEKGQKGGSVSKSTDKLESATSIEIASVAHELCVDVMLTSPGLQQHKNKQNTK